MQPLPVLFEDNHLLVVNKPCGIATMGTAADEPSLARQAAEYIKQKYNKPGNVFIGVVSRLDAFASGVMVFARTSKAASRLSDQIRRQSTGKRYLAWVEASVPLSDSSVLLEDYVNKNDASRRMQVVQPKAEGAQLAQMRYRSLLQTSQWSVLEVELLTGRKHQIRVQLAARGLTIYADSKYGSVNFWKNSIGLHCYQNVVQHPTQDKSMNFQCLPYHWQAKLGTNNFAELLGRLRALQTAENRA